MKAKKWKRPVIKELMRAAPEELVLYGCKDYSAIYGSKGPNCCNQYDCSRTRPGCADCCSNLGGTINNPS